MRGGALVRLGVVSLVAITVLGCGVPSVDHARTRTPGSGARATFVQPYAAVYRAGKVALERVRETPDWKELEIRVDDPDAGVLIAERRLEGVIPGLRVRDLWSLYFAEAPAGATRVTFVFESSDHPRATVSARSWAKGQEAIFAVMREVLDADVRGAAAREPDPTSTRVARRPAVAPTPAPTVQAERPAAAPTAARTEAPVATRPAPSAVPAGILDRAHAALRASDAWRVATHEQTIAGERVVVIGAWAQLTERGGRCQAAFADDPAPPAYDVARLMRFLADQGIAVDVLPASAFRRR